ncbi:kinase-like domain-containing protein [Hygrophoropsis aurantiaca]|uniref:Kinase-like domain-containing protein n=1 Tax=Hygrophoropsis aurantiaca TaxID=72124 RepID=A0ACB8AVA3_9AGAM|nr:kinase-like domain-containing protein [Hygrophoropsis aurantiaca]
MRADETIEASLICDPANDKANSSHIGSENPPFDISNHLADTISSDIDALECSLAAPLDNVVVSGSEAEIHATKPLVATQIIPSEEIPVCNSEHRPSREGGRSSPRILEFNGHQFTIMGTLGYGGFGFVWHAMMETGQEVAIKVIDKVLAFDHYMSSTNSTEDDNWRGSSLSAATTVWNEFKILEDLTSVGCAFLTPLLFSFSDDENFYLVMRLYPENLRQRMENRAAPLQLYQTRLLAAELVLAMETLHSMNIMHRDLKPENVFISPSGHLCVGDFGIAWQMPTPLSGGGFKSRKLMAVEGTFGYLSPEQSADQFAKSNYAGYDYKVDIYSVGLILLEMLVNDGRPWYRHTDPYFDPIYCGRKASPRPLWNLASVTDKNAADLVGKLLSDNPRRRPDWQEIREHPFFAGIDWNTLAERKYDPVYQACCSKRSRPPVEYVIRHHRQKLGSDFAEYKAYIDANKSHHASIGGLPIDFEILESMLLDRRHGSSCLAYDLCLCHSPSHWAMQGGRQCI